MEVLRGLVTQNLTRPEGPRAQATILPLGWWRILAFQDPGGYLFVNIKESPESIIQIGCGYISKLFAFHAHQQAN